jgi:hypothetical protein
VYCLKIILKVSIKVVHLLVDETGNETSHTKGPPYAASIGRARDPRHAFPLLRLQFRTASHPLATSPPPLAALPLRPRPSPANRPQLRSEMATAVAP